MEHPHHELAAAEGAWLVRGARRAALGLFVTAPLLLPLALIIIVIVSWLFYFLIAPAGWREWSRAGLVQAFIIALYAEMYGFP